MEKKRSGINSLEGSIRYEPFIVMLASHDAEWSMEEAGGPSKWPAKITKPAHCLRKNCTDFKARLSANFHNFLKAPHDPTPHESDKDEKKEVPPFCFEPYFSIPLGHADVFSITILDDFDPIDLLTSRMDTTLERFSVGFIPALKQPGPHIGNLMEILDPTLKGISAACQPLVVFSKFKLDGLVTAGLGLPFQECLWHCMVSRLNEVIEALKKKFPNRRKDNPDSILALDEIESLQCCFLDLQGCEEIGVLTFCSNLTAAFSVVRGIRTLTFADVVPPDSKDASIVNRSKLHEALVRQYESRLKLDPAKHGKDTCTALCQNHVFRWSDSSINVVPANWEGPNLFSAVGRVHGYISGISKFQISPGHCGVDQILMKPVGTREPFRDLKWSDLGNEYIPYTVGIADAITRIEGNKFERITDKIVPLQTGLDLVENKWKELCVSKNPTRGRDVVDFETDLIVPVPNLASNGKELIHAPVGDYHLAVLDNILPELAEQLFEKKGGALNIRFLREQQRLLGIPIALRRAIEYLFQNFAIMLKDPHAFDAALDLYDIFATLHQTLTVHLEKTPLPTCKGGANGRQMLLDEGRVEQLAEVIESLHNAMAHRMGNAFREVSWRDMGVDFRGGMNQILFAADVPLKCGLGVLRLFGNEHPRLKRNAVGCVMRITFNPGVRCYKARLGIESSACLAYLNVDVPHILHVASYADYLHEAFHLVFEESVATDSEFLQLREEMLSSSSTANSEKRGNSKFAYAFGQAEEIFAQMLWCMFVFGEDVETFKYHCVLTFSRDTASAGTRYAEMAARFSEYSIRLYFATAALPQRGDPRFWSEDYPLDKVTKEHFIEFVEEVGPFFSEFDDLWQSPCKEAFIDYLTTLYDLTIPRLASYLPLMWKKAVQIYRRTVSKTFPGDDPEELNARISRIKSDIRSALSEGKPLIWSQFQDNGKTGDMSDGSVLRNLKGDGMEPLILVCMILRVYIGTITDAKGRQMHLRRLPSNRSEPDYNSGKPWWGYQTEKTAAALFCPVPLLRQARLCKQIALIKSFWNMAAELRARRLLEMLNDTHLAGQ